MPYSNADDVRNALSQGGALDPTTAAGLPDDQLEDQIRSADATIHTYVGGRYAVPIVLPNTASDPAEPMRGWSRDIAAYLAADVYRKNRRIPEEAGYVRRYEHAMEQLRMIRDGKGRIDGAPLATPEGASDGDPYGTVTVVNPYCGELFPACDYLGGGGGW